MRLPQRGYCHSGRNGQSQKGRGCGYRYDRKGRYSKIQRTVSGKYAVKEITAPYGMVLNEEVHSVELVYAGQNVDVTETATSFYNERQRVEINLIKSLAIDEAYGIGKNGEIFDVTFGLYAAEELTAADGKTILRTV